MRRRLIDWERKNGSAPIEKDLPNHGIAEYFPRRHNAQLPDWPKNLVDPEEAAKINSVEKEVIDVLANEPDVNLADLDLEWWVAHGGSAVLRDRIRNSQ
jgi:hypothetical protein